MPGDGTVRALRLRHGRAGTARRRIRSLAQKWRGLSQGEVQQNVACNLRFRTYAHQDSCAGAEAGGLLGRRVQAGVSRSANEYTPGLRKKPLGFEIDFLPGWRCIERSASACESSQFENMLREGPELLCPCEFSSVSPFPFLAREIGPLPPFPRFYLISPSYCSEASTSSRKRTD
jgi:hypothetical protein